MSTDGWKGTKAAWKALFPGVVILLCFLHAWLKIRDRAKHLKESSRRSRGGSGRRTTRPTAGASGNGCVAAAVGEGAPDAGSSWRRSWTCAGSGRRWSIAYRHPGATGPATCSTG